MRRPNARRLLLALAGITLVAGGFDFAAHPPAAAPPAIIQVLPGEPR